MTKTNCKYVLKWVGGSQRSHVQFCQSSCCSIAIGNRKHGWSGWKQSDCTLSEESSPDEISCLEGKIPCSWESDCIDHWIACSSEVQYYPYSCFDSTQLQPTLSLAEFGSVIPIDATGISVTHLNARYRPKPKKRKGPPSIQQDTIPCV